MVTAGPTSAASSSASSGRLGCWRCDSATGSCVNECLSARCAPVTHARLACSGVRRGLRACCRRSRLARQSVVRRALLIGSQVSAPAAAWWTTSRGPFRAATALPWPHARRPLAPLTRARLSPPGQHVVPLGKTPWTVPGSTRRVQHAARGTATDKSRAREAEPAAFPRFDKWDGQLVTARQVPRRPL